MANAKTSLVTNEDAQPVVFNHVGVNGARVRTIMATFTSQASGSAGDTYVIAKLHPEWRINHIWVTNEAATSTNVDIGLVSDSSATAISDAATACYADNLTFASARTTAPADAAFATRTIDKIGQQVYQDAGHTEATKLNEYYLCVKAVAALGNSKKVSINVQFTTD